MTGLKRGFYIAKLKEVQPGIVKWKGDPLYGKRQPARWAIIHSATGLTRPGWWGENLAMIDIAKIRAT